MDLIINGIAALWLSIFGQETQHLPSIFGSRGLVVTNHHRKSDVLQVSLRNCQCGSFQHNPLDFCPCWGNFFAEDQPAVQGDPRIFVYYFLRPLFPQLDFVTDDGFGFGYEFSQLILLLPSPQKLRHMLEEIGLHEHFEFMPGDALVNAEEFLKLIAQGKTPISNINQETLNDVMAYQYFFHDIFVHFFIWAHLPDEIRNLIKNRARAILHFSSIIEEHIGDKKYLVKMWHFIISIIASRFDEDIGTLNNILFKNHLNNTPDLGNCFTKINFYRTQFERLQIRVYLESAINFGRYFSVERDDLKVMTFMDEKWFVINVMENAIRRCRYIKESFWPEELRTKPYDERIVYINILADLVTEAIVVDNDNSQIESEYIDVDTFINQLSNSMTLLKSRRPKQ